MQVIARKVSDTFLASWGRPSDYCMDGSWRAISVLWSVAIAFGLAFGCGAASLLGRSREVAVWRTKRTVEAGGMSHIPDRGNRPVTIFQGLVIPVEMQSGSRRPPHD